MLAKKGNACHQVSTRTLEDTSDCRSAATPFRGTKTLPIRSVHLLRNWKQSPTYSVSPLSLRQEHGRSRSWQNFLNKNVWFMTGHPLVGKGPRPVPVLIPQIPRWSSLFDFEVVDRPKPAWSSDGDVCQKETKRSELVEAPGRGDPWPSTIYMFTADGFYTKFPDYHTLPTLTTYNVPLEVYIARATSYN